MKTTIQEQDGKVVVLFEGRLDTDASSQTEKDIKPLKECAGKRIILDCTALEYISSSGLRLFLSVLKDAKAKGGSVCIKGMSPSINEVFVITGFINLFEFEK